MRLPLLLALAGTLLFTVVARADDLDTGLDAANAAYQKGRFEESAHRFEQLIKERGYSAPLLFDAGNAQLKAGHLGTALLDYERARFLAPNDAGIDHNLQLARHQAGLDPDPYRWWQIVFRTINWAVWLILIVSCLLLILVAIIGNAFTSAGDSSSESSASAWRKFFRALLFVCIPLALFFGFVELSAVGFGDRVEGVIMAKSATLRLSPFESAERTGTVPEGELVTVEKRHEDFLWIDDRSRQSGWVSEKELAPIVEGSFDSGK